MVDLLRLAEPQPLGVHGTGEERLADADLPRRAHRVLLDAAGHAVDLVRVELDGGVHAGQGPGRGVDVVRGHAGPEPVVVDALEVRGPVRVLPQPRRKLVLDADQHVLRGVRLGLVQDLVLAAVGVGVLVVDGRDRVVEGVLHQLLERPAARAPLGHERGELRGLRVLLLGGAVVGRVGAADDRRLPDLLALDGPLVAAVLVLLHVEGDAAGGGATDRLAHEVEERLGRHPPGADPGLNVRDLLVGRHRRRNHVDVAAQARVVLDGLLQLAQRLAQVDLADVAAVLDPLAGAVVLEHPVAEHGEGVTGATFEAQDAGDLIEVDPPQLLLHDREGVVGVVGGRGRLVRLHLPLGENVAAGRGAPIAGVVRGPLGVLAFEGQQRPERRVAAHAAHRRVGAGDLLEPVAVCALPDVRVGVLAPVERGLVLRGLARRHLPPRHLHAADRPVDRGVLVVGVGQLLAQSVHLRGVVSLGLLEEDQVLAQVAHAQQPRQFVPLALRRHVLDLVAERVQDGELVLLGDLDLAVDRPGSVDGLGPLPLPRADVGDGPL